MNDKEKIEKLTPFDEAKYENIDLDHLIMYVMGRLEDIGVDLSFENAVVATVKIFPKKFSLVGYLDCPDSSRVKQCLWRCVSNDRRWLGGRLIQGYIITEQSKRVITETEQLLYGKSFKKTQATSQTRRKESLLAEVLSSPVYLKYAKGERTSISEAEFCFLLQGTLDSSRESLKENFVSLKMFADELKRKEIMEFLNWLENRFKNFLNFNEK